MLKKKCTLLITGLCLITPLWLPAQRKSEKGLQKKELNIPMDAQHWEILSGKAAFTKYKNAEAISFQPEAGLASVKNLDFKDGTIEFDAVPLAGDRSPFVTVYFRFENISENEVFYLRIGNEGHKRNDAVQYAPVMKGVNLWDMLPQYQGPAVLHQTDWNHIKLVISGFQMRAYVNDMSRPALQIPYLEGNSKHGTIAVEGLAAFANMVVTAGAVEDLSPVRGVDLSDHDANYLRHWRVTQPMPLDDGRELTVRDFPQESIVWDSLMAERNGLINITRKYGVENRRYVWLRTTIFSAADVQRKIDLGFSDEVWVFVNGRMAYVDKNLYLQGMRKRPNGRCSIQNSSFSVALRQGDNDLLIGVANDFYGWGIIARLESLEGIEIAR